MTSFKKTLVLACAASVLSFGVAMAQTDPNAAPAAGATTAAPADAAAPAADAAAMPKKHMMKKHMAKKHHRHMKKKM
jgi:hypothetical protein